MVYTAAVLLAALGLWWLLPGYPLPQRRLGWLPLMVAVGLFASDLRAVGTWLDGAAASVFSLLTLISAVAAVTTRKPLYCALWFGMTVLGTAALILYSGAQFLAVATVVVYVGAILVTFLFLLMLDRPDGREPQDRTSWSPVVSPIIGLTLVGILSACLVRTVGRGEAALVVPPISVTATADEGGESGAEPSVGGVASPAQAEVTRTADLGRQLYLDYFAAVQVVALLLLAALVGAAVIIGRPLQPLQDWSGNPP
ncbi:NADH-quinone oxidoreductase subunit J family protein [Thermopirellula anaerolimosa]